MRIGCPQSGAPIKFSGSGEKIDALEEFHPERVAGRILGLGDIVGLVERAAETIDQGEAEKLAKKMLKGNFTLEDYSAQLKQIGFEQVDYVLIFNDTDKHFPAAAAVIKPQGGICTIVENSKPIAVELLKAKSAAFHWEFMFTRSMFGTPDMIEQHKLLTEVGRLVDAGTLRTTVGEWKLGTVEVSASDSEAGVTITSKEEKSLVRATIQSPASRNVKWTVGI